MSLFFLNIILMLAWVVVTAELTAINLIQGFIVGWIALWFTHPVLGHTSYFKKPRQIISLFIYFLIKLFSSSIRVVWDILTPTHKSNPGIISVPIDVKTDAQILFLSNMISLTPGTLSINISEDLKTLHIHAMFVDDINEFIFDIKQGIEKRIIELTS